jgi:hypothetical protein
MEVPFAGLPENGVARFGYPDLVEGDDRSHPARPPVGNDLGSGLPGTTFNGEQYVICGSAKTVNECGTICREPGPTACLIPGFPAVSTTPKAAANAAHITNTSRIRFALRPTGKQLRTRCRPSLAPDYPLQPGEGQAVRHLGDSRLIASRSSGGRRCWSINPGSVEGTQPCCQSFFLGRQACRGRRYLPVYSDPTQRRRREVGSTACAPPQSPSSLRP